MLENDHVPNKKLPLTENSAKDFNRRSVSCCIVLVSPEISEKTFGSSRGERDIVCSFPNTLRVQNSSGKRVKLMTQSLDNEGRFHTGCSWTNYAELNKKGNTDREMSLICKSCILVIRLQQDLI